MTTISYDIQVNAGNSVKTLGQLEGELESINSALKLVAPNSEAFDELTKSAQQATKQIEQINNKIEGFTHEDKIYTMDGAIKTFGGSVQTVVGSLGLLGIESEQFAKFEQYAASAIAFGMGLKDVSEGVGQLSVMFKKSGIAAKIFGSTTRKALISTGIGAFVVALGLVVAYWDDITKAISGADEKQQRYIDGLNETVKISEGQVGILNSQVTLLEAKGLSTLETNKKLLAQLKLQMDITAELIAQKQLELQETRDENAEVTFWEKIKAGIAGATGAYGLMGATLAEAVNPESEKTKELAEEINQLQIKRNNLEKEYIGIQQTVQTQTEMGTQVKMADIVATKGISESITGLNAASQINTSVTTEQMNANLQARNAENQRNAAIEMGIRLEEGKVVAMASTAQAMDALAGLMDQQSAAAKGLAIGSALINTYLGVTEVIKQKSTLPSPFDVITKVANVATVLATGLKAVQQIKNTSPRGGGGGRMSVPSAANIGGASPTPQTPTARTSGAINLDTSVANAERNQNQPIEAYVLEGNVTSAQEASSKIRQRRKVGRG